MRHGFAWIVLALSLLPVACSREEGAGAPTVTDSPQPATPPDDAGAPPASSGNDGHDYACADGFAFNARIDKGNAIVTFDGQKLTLAAMEGASDARFSGEGTTFIAQGNHAMLLRDGEKTRTCTAR